MFETMVRVLGLVSLCEEKMRSIKFRAFVNGSMKYGIPIDTDGKYHEISKYVQFDAPDILHDVMQYVGLKDKNGKEIYESDILKTRDCHGVPDKHISEVFFQNGQFQIKNLEDGPYLLGEVNLYSNVIGNIYETISSNPNE